MLLLLFVYLFVDSIDPKFTGSSVQNIAGKLNVTWSFRHTGGAPLTRVMVSCVSTNEEGSNDGDAIICTGNNLCGDVNNDGMVLLPSGSDVTAGMNYSCTVTATNNLGNSAASTTGSIKAVSGELLSSPAKLPLYYY